jgi:hypothetical protein
MLTTKDMGVSGANTTGKFPSIGAIVDRQVGARTKGMPGYVSIPYGSSVGLRPGYFGGNMLGVQHNPFETVADPSTPGFQVANLNLARGLTMAKLDDRRSLMRHFDQARAQFENNATVPAMDRFSQEAYEFISGSKARRAFDISREPPRLRDAYGRHSVGQSALLARRLVEAGSPLGPEGGV